MAESRVARKFRTYQMLHEINAAFQGIDNNLETLLKDELLEPDPVGVWRNHLGELQAEINMDLTGTLHRQEEKEIRRYAPLVEAHEEAMLAEATTKEIARRKGKTSKKPVRK